MHRETQASRMLGGLLSATSAKMQYYHGSWFHVVCVPCLSEQVSPDYPEMCCLSLLMWPSQMALSQQAHCLLVT